MQGNIDADDPDRIDTSLAAGGSATQTGPVLIPDGGVIGEETATENSDGRALSCPHYPYQWQYSGDSRYATCPNCRGHVNVQKHAVTGGED